MQSNSLTPVDPLEMETNDLGLRIVSKEEMKLIRRLRELPSGTHMAILHIDNAGVYGFSLLSSARQERLRPAGQV